MLLASALITRLSLIECRDRFDAIEISRDGGSLVVELVKGEALFSVGLGGDGRLGRIHASDFGKDLGAEDLDVEANGASGLPDGSGGGV